MLAVQQLHDRHRTLPVKLGRIPLLIVDEVGYIPFEVEAAKSNKLTTRRALNFGPVSMHIIRS